MGVLSIFEFMINAILAYGLLCLVIIAIAGVVRLGMWAIGL